MMCFQNPECDRDCDNGGKCQNQTDVPFRGLDSLLQAAATSNADKSASPEAKVNPADSSEEDPNTKAKRFGAAPKTSKRELSTNKTPSSSAGGSSGTGSRAPYLLTEAQREAHTLRARKRRVEMKEALELLRVVCGGYDSVQIAQRSRQYIDDLEKTNSNLLGLLQQVLKTHPTASQYALDTPSILALAQQLADMKSKANPNEAIIGAAARSLVGGPTATQGQAPAAVTTATQALQQQQQAQVQAQAALAAAQAAAQTAAQPLLPTNTNTQLQALQHAYALAQAQQSGPQAQIPMAMPAALPSMAPSVAQRSTPQWPSAAQVTHASPGGSSGSGLLAQQMAAAAAMYSQAAAAAFK